MKRIGILLLAALLCAGLFGCEQVKNVQDAFAASPEGGMIGKTFREVEAQFGPFSMVYLEKDRPAGYLFSKTNVMFHFDAPQAQASWASQLAGGVGFLPAAVALRSIRSTDVCIGVSGRIKDFGVADSDVNVMSQYMGSMHLASYDTENNTVYTLPTTDQAYEVFLYCAKGENRVTSDHQVRVMTAEMETVEESAVSEFSFGGIVVPVGATEVEVRGASGARRTVTAREFADLVKYCPHLRSLVLDYCDVTGEEQIGQLTELTNLEIMSCGIPDISFVSSLTKLTRLGVCHNHLSDVSAIEGLPLTYLNLGDNPNLGNSAVASVAKVTTLDTLYLYSLNISSLSDLRSLKRLNVLNVNNDSRITEDDLIKLKHLSHLHRLQINGTGVTSFDFIFDYFPNLRELEAKKMSKLQNFNQNMFRLAQHPHITKVTVSKDAQVGMDAYAWSNYGMDAEDYFAAQGVTLAFK